MGGGLGCADCRLAVLKTATMGHPKDGVACAAGQCDFLNLITFVVWAGVIGRFLSLFIVPEVFRMSFPGLF